MDKAEAIERLEYLKFRAQIALEQEVPDWIAEDVLGTIEAYDMAIEALQTEPSNSEIPNDCEHITEDGVTCAKYPACDDCLDNPLNKVKGSERLLKGKDEPQTCEECKHNGEKHAYDYACDKCTNMDKFQHEDEPQIDCAWM